MIGHFGSSASSAFSRRRRSICITISPGIRTNVVEFPVPIGQKDLYILTILKRALYFTNEKSPVKLLIRVDRTAFEDRISPVFKGSLWCSLLMEYKLERSHQFAREGRVLFSPVDKASFISPVYTQA